MNEKNTTTSQNNEEALKTQSENEWSRIYFTEENVRIIHNRIKKELATDIPKIVLGDSWNTEVNWPYDSYRLEENKGEFKLFTIFNDPRITPHETYRKFTNIKDAIEELVLHYGTCGLVNNTTKMEEIFYEVLGLENQEKAKTQSEKAKTQSENEWSRIYFTDKKVKIIYICTKAIFERNSLPFPYLGEACNGGWGDICLEECIDGFKVYTVNRAVKDYEGEYTNIKDAIEGLIRLCEPWEPGDDDKIRRIFYQVLGLKKDKLESDETITNIKRRIKKKENK